jgi:outer membrane immunogenic protein
LGGPCASTGWLAGRIGYAWDRWLGYVKGGAAWAHDTHRIFNIGIVPEVLDAAATVTRWGWMVGAGIEYGLAPNWSAKIEYDYMDFGTDRVTFTRAAGAPFALDVEQKVSLVKAGINYRFGAPLMR